MFTLFEYHELSGSDPIIPEVTIERRSTTLKSFDLYRKSGTCKVDNLPHSCEVSNCHLFVICSTNNRKAFQFHSQTVFQPLTYSMSKDGMSKDGRKTQLPLHVTLKVGVIASWFPIWERTRDFCNFLAHISWDSKMKTGRFWRKVNLGKKIQIDKRNWSTENKLRIFYQII